MIVRECPKVDEVVLQAALRCFDERGFARTTDLDVALRAGLTLTALQDRFADTQEMLGCLMDRATDLLFWQPARPSSFAELITEHERLIAIDPRLARVMVRERRHLENPYRRSWIARTAAYRERWLAFAPEGVVRETLNTINATVL